MKNVILTVILIILFIVAGWGIYNFYSVYSGDDIEPQTAVQTEPDSFVTHSDEPRESPEINVMKVAEDDGEVVDETDPINECLKACPIGCPAPSSQICASDGKMYCNECVIKCNELEVADDQVCEPEDIDAESQSSETTTTSVVQSDNIKILTPTDDETVVSPIEVTGKAKIGDSQLYIRITTIYGNTIILVPANLKNVDADGWGEYKASIEYEFESTKEGYLEIFSQADDESPEENLTKVKLNFE